MASDDTWANAVARLLETARNIERQRDAARAEVVQLQQRLAEVERERDGAREANRAMRCSFENATAEFNERRERLNALAAENEALRADKARMIDMLTQAASKFDEYTRIHESKGTDEGHHKAVVNHSMAEACRAAMQGGQQP